MPNFNFDAHGPFGPGSGEGDKESMPASEGLKQDIYDHAREAARTGNYREPFESSSGSYMKDAEVPGAKDTLTVVSYDAPSQKPGLEGLVMQITHGRAVEGSRVVTDKGLELHRWELAKYKFFKIPDGLHVDREVDLVDEPIEYYRSGAPKTVEEIDWDAHHKAMQAADEDRAMQREMGLNFFSQHDAEDLMSLLGRVWPKQA